MSMDNFDDYEEDEFAESSSSTPPADVQETPSEGENEDDLTSEVLRLKGIDNPNEIKFQDESGAIVNRSWDSLSREEQINILGDVKENTEEPEMFAEDELNLIHAIRNSGMDVNSYMQSMVPQVQQSQDSNVIEGMSDEDLYAFDILNKVGNDNITDDELDQAIESAKSNEELFKKTVAGLRNQYNGMYQQKQAQVAAQAQQAKEQRYNAFANVVNSHIDNFSNFAGQPIVLSNDDKDLLSDFMLTLDDAGYSQLGHALQDPALLTKAAFWLLNEDNVAAELQRQVQDAYTRGFNAGKGDILNKSKFVFQPKKSSKKSDPAWDSDDWD